MGAVCQQGNQSPRNQSIDLSLHDDIYQADKYQQNNQDLIESNDIPYQPSNPQAVTHMSQMLGDYNERVKGFDELFKEYSQQQIEYMDTDFPHSVYSVAAPERKRLHEYAKKLVWNNIREMHKKYSIFPSHITPNQVTQGSLGDCYLIGAIAALAAKDYLITRLFHVQEDNKIGIYGIWLCDSGEWTLIPVDGFFPYSMKLKQPAFARFKENSIWVMLLEKAYAKLYGNYGEISAGWPTNALRDLTGAPVDEYNHLNPKTIGPLITTALSKGNLITTFKSSESKNTEQYLEGTMIVRNHVYTILDYKNEGNQVYLKLRNPWGINTFTDQETFEDEAKKAQVDLNQKNTEKGTFWATIEGFCKQFNTLGICKVSPNYKYCNIQLDQNSKDEDCKFSLVKVTVYSQENHGFFKVIQRSKRHVRKFIKDYKFSKVRLFLVKLNQGNLEWKCGSYKADHSMEIETTLEPGEYFLLIDTEWIYDLFQTLVLAWYGQDHILFEDQYIPKEQYALFQRQSFQNFLIEKHQEGLQQSHKVYGTDYGLMYYYFRNQGKKEVRDKIHIQNTQNLELHHPGIDSFQKEIRVKPGAEELYLFKTCKNQPRIQVKLPQPAPKKEQFPKLIPLDDLERTSSIIQQFGTQYQRKKDEKNVEIYYYVLKFGDSLGLLYENKTQKQTLSEKVTYKLTNCSIIIPKTQGNKIHIKVPPKSKQLIVVKVIDPNKPFDCFSSARTVEILG